MKVAACQPPDVRNDWTRAISLICARTLEAERVGAHLVCFPECFLQGYDTRAEYVASVAIELNSAAFDDVLENLKSLKPVVVFGLIEKENSSFYNSALAIARGKVVAHYRKAHLLKGEQAVFEPGESAPVFDVLDVRVGINICYDLVFPDSVKRAADAGAKLLVCPCSNMMPRDLAEEWKSRHNDVRAQRAKEQGIWILSSEIFGERDDLISYGPTAVIDPRGNVVAQVALLEAGMVVAEIN
jgi:predicted amidohydrolase